MCYLELTHRFVKLQISLQLFDHMIYLQFGVVASLNMLIREQTALIYTQ